MPTDSLININGGSVQTLEILFLTTLIALLPDRKSTRLNSSH